LAIPSLLCYAEDKGGRDVGQFGVVTRYRSHVGAFSLAFWETKDVGGAQHPPVPGAVPMVSCFGDNRVAKEHPDWVQVGPAGVPATRDLPYFDWAALCPTRPEVRELARAWVAAASVPGQGLRLDDVTYARRDFCQCAVCEGEARSRGVALWELRQQVLSAFVQEMRAVTRGPLYLTLYPDPYPGRLEEEYGLWPADLRSLVDCFVVPIYDLAYSTTWWLENLARAFRERLQHPFLVELYGLGVDAARLEKAALVAGAYADGVLVAYDRDLEKLQRIERAYRNRYPAEP
jgi:hypothetical protein